MPYYRVYHVNESNVFRSVDDAECDSDSEAIAFARAKLKGMPVELWNLARRVARLAPDGSDLDGKRLARRSRSVAFQPCSATASSGASPRSNMP